MQKSRQRNKLYAFARYGDILQHAYIFKWEILLTGLMRNHMIKNYNLYTTWQWSGPLKCLAVFSKQILTFGANKLQRWFSKHFLI